jgi:hypothetical protein
MCGYVWPGHTSFLIYSVGQLGVDARSGHCDDADGVDLVAHESSAMYNLFGLSCSSNAAFYGKFPFYPFYVLGIPLLTLSMVSNRAAFLACQPYPTGVLGRPYENVRAT